MFRLIITTLCLYRAISYGNQSYSKRLLLSDPDVVIDRLTKLENILTLQSNRISQLENMVKTLQQQSLEKHSGSTYMVWGRTSCPGNETELVYSGYVGGGIRTETGSSQDLLCLTQNPVFAKISGTVYAHIYGAEYDDDFFATHANGEDIPCAVCHRKTTTSTVMIPGRNACYPNWIEEYHGYLSTGYFAQESGSNYICIDSNPEFLVAGEVNTNQGRLLGAVYAQCGVLKCPPYHQDYPVTCVVCSR